MSGFTPYIIFDLLRKIKVFFRKPCRSCITGFTPYIIFDLLRKIKVFFRKPCRSCITGFTLPELLIAVAIVAVIVGIGLPVFKNLQPTLELSGAVRDLVSDIRLAQQLAVTEQVDHGVRFATSTNEYRIIKYTNPEEVLQEKALPQEVSFLETTGLDGSDAIFNPYGAVRTAGAVSFVNSQNATTTIDIRPSGFVRIIK